MDDSNNPIIHIAPLIVDRDRQKICQCKNPKYILDTKNRLVICDDCGAIIDPFDALMDFAEHWERYADRLIEVKEQAQAWAKIAQEEHDKVFRYRGVASITTQYKHGMFPACPKCGEAFDPSSIDHFVNGEFYGIEK